MKQLLFVMGLCISLAFCVFTSCEKDDEASIVGSWKGVAFVEEWEGGTEEYDWSSDVDWGDIWNFKQDGTFEEVYSVDGETFVGTWEMNGNTLYLGGDYDMTMTVRTLTSKSLVLVYHVVDFDEESDLIITFKRI